MTRSRPKNKNVSRSPSFSIRKPYFLKIWANICD